MGYTHLAATEGKSINVGADCMFSSDVVIRAGDSYSIIDYGCKRINHAKDVAIGNHVWLGNKVIILKGAEVSDNSIIGTGSVVLSSFKQSNVIIAGILQKL